MPCPPRIAAVVVASVLLVVAPAAATIINFSATIDGAQEVPGCGSGGVGVPSGETGSGTFVMDTCANTLSVSLSFSGLETAPESAAHIHGFAPAGANAGILFGLPGGSPKNTVWSFLESQEAGIIAGMTYVNIHGQPPCGAGEIRGQILQDPAQPTPGPCPTTTPTPTATATATETPLASPTQTPDTDHYVLYKAKAPKIESELPDMNKFPAQGYNLRLDDVTLPNSEPDDPENYQVKKEKSLAAPAMKNDEPGPVDPALHYIRFQIKEAKEGAGAFDPVSGRYPKAVKHKKRIWDLQNQFGTINILTKKVEAMLVPSAKDLNAPVAPIGDHTHYICYQAKVTKDVTDQTPDAGSGKGKFRKDIEAYFGDQFLDVDCLLDRNASLTFPGTPVAGKCLLNLKKVKFLCNPADKADVGGTRETVAPPGSISAVSTADSLLCYQVKLVSKVASQAAATLGSVSVGDVLKQSKHVQRSPYTGPGNQFPSPIMVDTKKTEFACVPTFVVSVVDAP